LVVRYADAISITRRESLEQFAGRHWGYGTPSYFEELAVWGEILRRIAAPVVAEPFGEELLDSWLDDSGIEAAIQARGDIPGEAPFIWKDAERNN